MQNELKKELSPVEWFVDQIAENLGIRVKNSSIGMNLIQTAKEMEEENKHSEYMRGWKEGYKTTIKKSLK